MTLVVVFLILMCGALDRVRGSNKDILGLGILDKFLYSIVIGLLVGIADNTPVFVVFVLLYSLGMSFGWGTPLGSYLGKHSSMDQTKLEWWQFGYLKHDALSALVVRGALWGACVLPLAYWAPSVLYAYCAISIAFPLSAWLARTFDSQSKYQWEHMEVYRGMLNAGILVLITEIASKQ